MHILGVFLGHLPRHCGLFFFGYFADYIIQLLQLFLGHLHGPGSFFFRFSAHCIIQLLWFCLGHLSRHRGCFFRVFRTLHHSVALVLLGKFIRTQGLFLSGFPHTASSSCSSFSQEIYLDTEIVFFGFSAHCIIQLLQFCSGHLFLVIPHTTLSSCSSFSWDIYMDLGVFFSGFPHTTSSRCSSFSWDIYTDMVVFFIWAFRTVHHADAPVLLGTLPGHRSWFFRDFHTLHHPDAPAFLGTFTQTWGLFFFGFSTHYIMQMLRIFLGHLPGHRGCSFQVFMTLHHAYPPGFLRTFTRTLWVVFFGFLYILQMLWKFHIFLGHLPRQGLLFLGFPHTTSYRCSGLSWDIYLDTRAVFLGFSAQY